MAAIANNFFGWNLLSLMSKQNSSTDNIFLSPFSISVALAMTELGAKGETAVSMEKALCWGSDRDLIHKEFEQYIEQIKKPRDTCILRTANRIYVEGEFRLLDTFLNQTKQLYSAEAVSAQFKTNPAAERVNINSWVEEQTEKKIKDLIQPGVLDERTRMVLVNAIYFKGEWIKEFDGSDTRPQQFYRTPSMEKSVPMMHMSEYLPYHKAKGYAVLELPYKGHEISMVIFLPHDRFGLGLLQQKLTTEEIKDSISKLKSDANVKVTLPKFEINCSMTLKPILSEIGMAKAFDDLTADFSGMTGSKDLCISEVVHKSFLRVDEKGSEAAAATAVQMMLLSCPMHLKTVSFVADHPFLVVIRDKTNGMVLFMGHVADPSVSG